MKGHGMRYAFAMLILLWSIEGFSQTLVVTPVGLRNSSDTEKPYVVLKVDSASAKQLYENSLNPDTPNGTEIFEEICCKKSYFHLYYCQ